jgi:hypothetical protein
MQSSAAKVPITNTVYYCSVCRCYFSSAVGLTVDAEATAAARKAGSSAAAASDAMDVADDDEDSTVSI